MGQYDYDDDEGSTKGKQRWSREQLHGSAVVLSLQTGTNKFASQKGMTGFGQPRTNLYKTKDLGELKPDLAGEGILRTQYGTNKFASQKGMTAMGAIRLNIPKVEYKENWTQGPEKDGEAVIPMQAGTNKFASQAGGEIVIGKKRNTKMMVLGRMPRDRKAEMMIPYQSGTNIFANQAGGTQALE